MTVHRCAFAHDAAQEKERQEARLASLMAIQACGKIENKRQLDDLLSRIRALVKGRETAEMNEQISKLRKAFAVEGLRDRISIGSAVTMLQKQIEKFEREGDQEAFHAERFMQSGLS